EGVVSGYSPPTFTGISARDFLWFFSDLPTGYNDGEETSLS
ncbi:2968_t:CDS:1, partial [Gigaspora rosea]